MQFRLITVTVTGDTYANYCLKYFSVLPFQFPISDKVLMNLVHTSAGTKFSTRRPRFSHRHNSWNHRSTSMFWNDLFHCRGVLATNLYRTARRRDSNVPWIEPAQVTHDTARWFAGLGSSHAVWQRAEQMETTHKANTVCNQTVTRIRQLADCQLADWTSRGLDKSRTGQLADATGDCVPSFRSFGGICKTASCPVHDLSSPRVDQSASWQSAIWHIHELSSYQSNWLIWLIDWFVNTTIMTLCNYEHDIMHKSNKLSDRCTSGQCNLTKALHCHRTQTFQSYSPGCANVHPHLIHGSLGPPKSTSQTTSWSVQPFLLAHNCDRQTDRPWNSVRNNRLHLRT